MVGHLMHKFPLDEIIQVKIKDVLCVTEFIYLKLELLFGR